LPASLAKAMSCPSLLKLDELPELPAALVPSKLESASETA
jgi:hypothetical protein